MQRKSELCRDYGMIRCESDLFEKFDRADILAYRREGNQWNILVGDKEMAKNKYKNVSSRYNNDRGYAFDVCKGG